MMDANDWLRLALDCGIVYIVLKALWKEFMPDQKPYKKKHKDLPKILGALVKDPITGFQGVATSYHIFLTGCNRVGVQPPVDKEGKVPESITFDEDTLHVLEASEESETPAPEKERGGPLTRGSKYR